MNIAHETSVLLLSYVLNAGSIIRTALHIRCLNKGGGSIGI